MMKTLRTALAGSLLLLLAAPSHAYNVVEVTGGGSIAGAVSYEGTARAAASLEVTQDQDFCGQGDMPDESLLVSSSNGLANVIVFLKDPPAGRAPVAGTHLLDNSRCRYVPHVMAMTVGSQIQVKNSDPILHNTHARLPKADVFNYALPRQGQILENTVTRPGLMKVGCDAGHTWMSAYIAAFEHPYFAVTDAQGQFGIEGVPPGTYTLVFWHERLGSASQQVTVTSDGVQANQAYK